MLIRPRWRKVLHDLWSHKARSLLVIASIAIGVFAIGLIATLYSVITDDMRVGYEATNPANIILSTYSVSPDYLDTIKRMPGVKDAQGARTFSARAHKKNGEWIYIDLNAIYDIEHMQVDRVGLIDGTWPPRDDEIVFDHYKVNQTQAQIGDTLEIKLASDKIRQLHVTGIIQDQSIGAEGHGGFFLSSPQGYIHFDSLERLEQPEKINSILITVSQDQYDEEKIRQIAFKITERMKNDGITVLSTIIRRSNDHPNSIYTEAISGLLFSLGFLVVFLSAFLITNTLSALLNQQTTQIGIMKSLGARRPQVILLYIALIAVYSLIALAIALPITGRLAYALGGFLSREINYIQQGYRVIPISVFLQVTVALLVPQFAGIFPILRGSQVTVQEALNGLPQSGGNASSDWIDSLATRSRNLPRPMLISLRNTFRKKIRLILTLFTLTLGGAIFIATFVVQSSLEQYIDRISKYFTADVSITFDRPYRMTDVENVARELPEVTAVEGWVSTVAEISMEKGNKGESVSILAPPANSQLIQPMLIKGRWIIPGDQNAIAVNERFISLFPNLKVGDTLKLKIDNDDTDWVVVGIFQFAGKSGGYLAYANYDYLSKMIHTSFRSQVYRVAANLQGHDQQSQENFGQRLEDHFKLRGYNVIDISTGRWMQSAASEGLNVLLAFLLMMASLIAIVGSIGLTGTMSMNVMERTREIGVMRAIGASDRAIMSQVIVEGLIIGGLSWIFGSLLAFPISRAMADGVSYALFGAPAIFNYTPTGFLVWLAVAIVLSVFASVLPARNAARLTIREVLAYE